MAVRDPVEPANSHDNYAAATAASNCSATRGTGEEHLRASDQYRPISLAGHLLASIRKPRPPWSVEAFALLIVSIGVAWVAWAGLVRVRHLIWLGVVAAFLYLALAPAVEALTQRRWPRSLATAVVVLTLAGLSWVLLVALTPLVVAEFDRAIKEVPTGLARLGSLSAVSGVNLDQSSTPPPLQMLLIEARDALPSVTGGAVSLNSEALGDLSAGLVVLILTFGLLAGQERLRGRLLSLLSPPTRIVMGAAWDQVIVNTGALLYARMFTALLAGTFMGIALGILGCPYPVVLAVWFGLVSQFIPRIGMYVATVPPLMMLLLLHNRWDALWLLVVLAVWVPLHDHMIRPRLAAKMTDISPTSAIIALAVGAAIFGAFGAFLALPSAAAIQSLGSAFFTRPEVTPE